MKNKSIFLGIGQLAMCVGIILSRFFKDSEIASFVSGLLLGLSLVFNIAFLIGLRKQNSR